MNNVIAVDIIANVGVVITVLAVLVTLTRNMRNDLDARLGDLNAQVGNLNARVDDLNVRVDDLKQEQVRTRQEMHALNDGLRQEMHALHKEVRQEIGEVRRDLSVVSERTARIEGAALGLRRSFNGPSDAPHASPRLPGSTDME